MDHKLVTIGLAGDVMIGRGVDRVISAKGYSYPWGNMLPLLKTSDVNFINLEVALTSSSKIVDKTFNFKASPDKVKTLTEAGITAVNLANNHILDFSEEGLIETIRTLDKAGIQHVGAGMNSAQAAKPLILRAGNVSLGIIGLTDNEPGWKATASDSGTNYVNVCYPENRRTVLQSILKLNEVADIVMVSIHWGPNMNEQPFPHFVEFAHQMIDHGADIIHGHSAHNFQGIEVYKGKPILYDTGDFVDDYAVDPYFRNDHGFFFTINVSKERIESLTLTPVLIAECQVNTASAEDYNWCLKRMQKLSGKFGTQISERGEVLLH